MINPNQLMEWLCIPLVNEYQIFPKLPLDIFLIQWLLLMLYLFLDQYKKEQPANSVCP